MGLDEIPPTVFLEGMWTGSDSRLLSTSGEGGRRKPETRVKEVLVKTLPTGDEGFEGVRGLSGRPKPKTQDRTDVSGPGRPDFPFTLPFLDTTPQRYPTISFVRREGPREGGQTETELDSRNNDTRTRLVPHGDSVVPLAGCPRTSNLRLKDSRPLSPRLHLVPTPVFPKQDGVLRTRSRVKEGNTLPVY